MSIDKITVEVATPKGVFKGIFPYDATVSDIIKESVGGSNMRDDLLELVYKGEVLPLDKTLEELGIKGTVQFELVATGAGV